MESNKIILTGVPACAFAVPEDDDGFRGEGSAENICVEGR
jgi:hypothetical protein